MYCLGQLSFVFSVLMLRYTGCRGYRVTGVTGNKRVEMETKETKGGGKNKRCTGLRGWGGRIVRVAFTHCYGDLG